MDGQSRCACSIACVVVLHAWAVQERQVVITGGLMSRPASMTCPRCSCGIRVISGGDEARPSGPE